MRSRSEYNHRPAWCAVTCGIAASEYRRSRSHGVGASAELDPGRLHLGVLVEGVQRLVAADARLLVAAERRGDVAAVVGVDPHRAGAQALGELEGLVDVAT